LVDPKLDAAIDVASLCELLGGDTLSARFGGVLVTVEAWSIGGVGCGLRAAFKTAWAAAAWRWADRGDSTRGGGWY
jgi:hypothetical protein